MINRDVLIYGALCIVQLALCWRSFTVSHFLAFSAGMSALIAIVEFTAPPKVTK